MFEFLTLVLCVLLSVLFGPATQAEEAEPDDPSIAAAADAAEADDVETTDDAEVIDDGMATADDEATANAEEEAESAEDAAKAAKTLAERRERYRSIVDRMPFGPLPPNFDPDAPATHGAGGGAAGGALDPAAAEVALAQEQQQILAAVRVSALNVTPASSGTNAIAVGFTDSSRQPPANYYLHVGESRDGWTVKSADANRMTVVLEKDGVEAELALGASSDGKGGKRGAAPGKENPPLLGAVSSVASKGSALSSLKERRRQKVAEERRQQEAAKAEAEAERRREAEREEREAQRDAERKAENDRRFEQLQAIAEELQRNNQRRQAEDAQPLTDNGGEAPAEE